MWVLEPTTIQYDLIIISYVLTDPRHVLSFHIDPELCRTLFHSGTRRDRDEWRDSQANFRTGLERSQVLSPVKKKWVIIPILHNERDIPVASDAFTAQQIKTKTLLFQTLSVEMTVMNHYCLKAEGPSVSLTARHLAGLRRLTGNL